MGYPPGAVTLPCPDYAGLAPGVARITACWGADPAELVALLRAAANGADGRSDDDQLAAIAWVLDPAARHVLLVDHRSYGWSCPGGHVERGEDPATAAARELAEETGLALSPADPDPVTLTLVDVPPGTAGPAHRHWLLGYRFVADRAAPLVPERDPVAWHPLDRLPTPATDDLAPLLAAITA
jgi:8-oxo-dGTP pyrophosphatase MutT (NUDIX family)